MSLVINLTPNEEAQLKAAATKSGLEPAELAEKLVREHLPVSSDFQLGYGNRRESDRATVELLTGWAEQEAQITYEERAENDHIYAEIEKNGIPRVQI